jgi:hypothetical protein
MCKRARQKNTGLKPKRVKSPKAQEKISNNALDMLSKLQALPTKNDSQPSPMHQQMCENKDTEKSQRKSSESGSSDNKKSSNSNKKHVDRDEQNDDFDDIERGYAPSSRSPKYRRIGSLILVKPKSDGNIV